MPRGLVMLGVVVLTGCMFDRSGLAVGDQAAGVQDAAAHDASPAHETPADFASVPDGPTAWDLRVPDEALTPDVEPPPPLDTDQDGIPDADDPCPTLTNPLLIDDEFDINTGWTSFSGSWILDGGDYYQQTLGSYCQGQHLYRPGLSESDLYLEVSMTRVTGSTSASDCHLMGVTARSQVPSSKTYQFCGLVLKSCTSSCNTAPVGMYGFGWQGGYLPAGPQTLTTPAVTGSFDGPYLLRMSVRGNQVRCWLAGDKSTEIGWSADGLGAGTIALFTETATARFHRLRLFSIPAGCP